LLAVRTGIFAPLTRTASSYGNTQHRATAETAIATFAEKYAPKYDKAVECLIKNRETLLTFFDFPADYWDHLRTTNPISAVAPHCRNLPMWPSAKAIEKRASKDTFRC
jgi:putative transposase